MTLEEALRVHKDCDPDEEDCHKCPLGPKQRLDVGVIGVLETSPCELLNALVEAVKGVKYAAR